MIQNLNKISIVFITLGFLILFAFLESVFKHSLVLLAIFMFLFTRKLKVSGNKNYYLVPLLIVSLCLLMIILPSVVSDIKLNIIGVLNASALLIAPILGMFATKRNAFYVFFGLILVYAFATNYVVQTFSSQKTNYNNYSGIVEIPVTNLNSLELFDSNKQGLSWKDLTSKKVLVIDFWNNQCSVCIQKFPDFENFMFENEKYKNVEFISLNVIKDTSVINRGNELFGLKLLKFNNFYVKDQNLERFQLDFFPSIIVVKEEKIVFRGTMEMLNHEKKQIFE
jgi:thiol-disulfide isomerase/thioredoxin